MRGFDDALVYPCSVVALLQKYNLQEMYAFAILELVDSIFALGSSKGHALMVKERGGRQKRNEKERISLFRYFFLHTPKQQGSISFIDYCMERKNNSSSSNGVANIKHHVPSSRRMIEPQPPYLI